MDLWVCFQTILSPCSFCSFSDRAILIIVPLSQVLVSSGSLSPPALFFKLDLAILLFSAFCVPVYIQESPCHLDAHPATPSVLALCCGGTGRTKGNTGVAVPRLTRHPCSPFLPAGFRCVLPRSCPPFTVFDAFDAMLGICILKILSSCLLLVYRSRTEFYKLTLLLGPCYVYLF